MRCSWIALGLGNPEREYGKTRHNAGIAALKFLVSGMCGGCVQLDGHSFSALLCGELLVAVQRCFMNESGLMIRELRSLGLDTDQWLVVHDDLAIDLGRIKITRGGRSGGHRGVEGISASLGHDEFARVKIGIAYPEGLDRSLMRDYVLGTFSSQELSVIQPALIRAASATLCVIEEGVGRAMERFN